MWLLLFQKSLSFQTKTEAVCMSLQLLATVYQNNNTEYDNIDLIINFLDTN
jgi:hypothetical protein